MTFDMFIMQKPAAEGKESIIESMLMQFGTVMERRRLVITPERIGAHYGKFCETKFFQSLVNYYSGNNVWGWRLRVTHEGLESLRKYVGDSKPATGSFREAIVPDWRERLDIARYGYTLFGKEIMDVLSKQGKILSVGCGTAYLESCMASAGIDITPTDICHPEDSGYPMRALYMDVEHINGKKAVKTMEYDSLLLSWPHGWELPMLRALPSGKTLIMIGEGSFGCCASDKSWGYIERNFEEVLWDDHTVVNFDGMNDFLSIWRKK